MSIRPPRQAFSLNLYEDYEIYGIDPDEDLNDWSFLDQKPEPIPEKSEEEKRLFEALLAPSIPDEEIQSEIHDRLKSLLAETDDFIQNDVKVELSAPIAIAPEAVKPLIDEDSFEHKQAAKVSSLVKDLLNTTQESESIDDLIKTLTKSDEVAEQISKEIEESPSNDSQIPDQKVAENSVKPPKTIEPPKQQETPKPGLLSRYVQKPSEKIKIIKKQDETERLSSQFILERRKRQEEAEAELKRKQEETERKQKEFFESIAKEKEKHKREVQMIKEMKENHGPSFSEMLNNIKKPVEQPKPIQAVKPKQTKPVKEPRMSTEQISQFYAERDIKLNAAMKKPETPLLIVDLQTNHLSEDEKKGQHISNKYKTTVLTELGKILIPKIKKYLESHKNDKNEGYQLKLALYLRMMAQLKLNRYKKEIQKNLLIRRYLKDWSKKRLFSSLTKTVAAYKIQLAFRIYNQKRKVELSLQKARQAAELAQRSIEEHNKEISQEQLLDKTRQILNSRIKIDNKKSSLPNLPELPDMNDLDWADRFGMKDSISGFSDDEDFLSTLPEYLPKDNREQNKEIRSSVIAESQSVPLEVIDYDYLAGFNQHIDLNDENEQHEQQNVVVRPPPPRPPPHPVQQPLDQPQFGENEGYHFDNPRTAAMMQAMQRRRQNFANKNVRENPIDKFQRLYGKKKNTPPPLQGQNHQEEFVPIVRRSEFKKNDARAKRLMKLKQVWLHPPDGSDQ